MRIALTVTEGRIASLFETAQGLRVITREGGRRWIEDVPLPGPSAADRVVQVLATGADLVVTGGIARMFRWMLEGRGVSVLPWVVGPVEAVISRLERGASGPRCVAVSARDAKPDAEFEPCFGRSRFFGVRDPEGGWEFLPVDPGEDMADRLAGAGLQALVTGSIGPIAAGLLRSAGILVVRAEGGTLEEVVAAYESGRLPTEAEPVGRPQRERLLAIAGAGDRRRSRKRPVPAAQSRRRVRT